MRTIKERDDELEKLWSEFADVPVNQDTEETEEQFLDFPAGTHREEIWHWFDERYSKGVAHLMYRDGVDRTDVIARYVYRDSLCRECDVTFCAYNSFGVCRMPLIYGRKPEAGSEDETCGDFVLAEVNG